MTLERRHMQGVAAPSHACTGSIASDFNVATALAGTAPSDLDENPITGLSPVPRGRGRGLPNWFRNPLTMTPPNPAAPRNPRDFGERVSQCGNRCARRLGDSAEVA